MQDKKVILLFSGGQDSAICLALALERYESVYTLGFDYGQNHACELAARQDVLNHTMALFPQWKNRFQEDRILSLSELHHLAPTSLTRSHAFSSHTTDLPSTFVPGRNLLFFLYAAIWGYQLDCFHLMGGMCEVDYSGYPDCREDTLQTLGESFQKGFLKPFSIIAPLMHTTKAASWALIQEKFGQPFVDLVIEHTHTCYRGERDKRHDWGYGCGLCDACRLRERGYHAFLASS